MPPRPGVGKGAGPGGLWPPERRPGPAPRRTTGRGRGPAPAPTPPPGRWGVPAGGGRIRRRRRHGRRQGRQPHAKAAVASDRATAPTAERPGGGAAAPRTQAASNETGRRPTTGRGRTRPGRCDGAGAAGPGQYRPGLHPTGRIPFLSQPATFGGGLGQPPRGRPRPQGAFAPETAGGPRGPGAAAYGQGLTERGAADPVPGGGEVRIEAGAVPPGRGAAWRQKKWPGGFPPGWTRLDEKKCGEDALSPPLAVTADTRYPPVRRSSPRRTRCRPVPYALAVRRLPGPPSCVP